MPEGPEVETERLTETIHEELEKEGGRPRRDRRAARRRDGQRGARLEDRGDAPPGRSLRPVGVLPGEGDQGRGRGGLAHVLARDREGGPRRVRGERDALQERAGRDREEGK